MICAMNFGFRGTEGGTAPVYCVLLLMLAGCAMGFGGGASTVLGQGTAAAAKTASTDPAALGEARKTFSSICAACHGLDGHGGERGPDIASRQVQAHSDEELMRTVRNGISETGMPNFAYLGEAKIEGLVGYLRELQGKSEPLPMPGDPQRGATLFSTDAKCAQCHMANGKGGFIAPDLTAFAAGTSPADIRRAIMNPSQDDRRNRGQVVVTFKDGHSQEGMVRNEDNFSLQLQSLDGAFHLVQKSEISAVTVSTKPIMHAEYGKMLAPKELDDLVSYLMRIAEKEPQKEPGKRKHHAE
jgi:cytochrome c oxidase cbb3-type subunit III